MNQESLNEHYKSIAKNYEDMFANSHEDGYTFMGKEGARELMKMMQLKVDDKLVDLGAGTCKTAGYLSELANLKEPVLCVEPVQEMLDVALDKKVSNIETLCITAEDFAKQDIHYDKILIKGTVHHFPISNFELIFGGIYKQLNNNGILLIEKTDENSNTGPFFKKGMTTHVKKLGGLSDLIVNTLKSIGFKTEQVTKDQKVVKTKEEAMNYVRNRSVSSWEAFSDEEIEEEVKNIQNMECDSIEYFTQREMIIASK